MSLAAAAFMYAAIATSTGALAFLAGQRMSGRTSKEVQSCYEQATLLESVARDLRALSEDDARDAAPEEGREELARASDRLEEAIRGLRRGADLVV